MKIEWNKLIAAVEYMNAAELSTFKGEDFDIKHGKNSVTITVKT